MTAPFTSFSDEFLKIAAVTTKLLPHQERVVKRLQQQPGLVAAHGLGAGKTLSSIAAAVSFKPGKTQVLAPAGLVSNYKKEWAKHTEGEDLPEVRSLEGAVRKGDLAESDLLIVDEAHRARSPGSKTYKSLINAKTGKRLLLTASPIYNKPRDIASMVNVAAGKRVLPTGDAFDNKFIAKPFRAAAFIPLLRKKEVLKNKDFLARELNTWVDANLDSPQGAPRVVEERVQVPMLPKQENLHTHAWGQLPWGLRKRLEGGLPIEKKDLPKLNMFESQTRQISGSLRRYGDVSVTPKVDRVVSDALGKKTLIYSNFLGTLDDVSAGLAAKGIPHAEITGKKTKKDRDAAVKDYNEGRLGALLVSSAGGEGLDLKGTQQVQVMDPHWNNEKIRQVVGRAVRMNSHDHLPEKDRVVHVKKYESVYRAGKKKSIEQILNNLADDKDALRDRFIGLLRRQDGSPR